jgi:hypothetical protein
MANQKYAVVVDRIGGSAVNPSVITFCADQDAGAYGFLVETQMVSLMLGLATLGGFEGLSVRQVTRSALGSQGPGTPLNVTKNQVNDFLVQMNANLPADLQVDPFSPSPSSALGVRVGQNTGKILPLGTSVYVQETPVDGPRGGMYLPHPNTSILGDNGKLAPDVAERIGLVIEAAYGIPDGEQKFRVYSKRLGSAQPITGVSVSAQFGFLRSRKN